MATTLGRHFSAAGFAAGSRARGDNLNLNLGQGDTAVLYGSNVALQDFDSSLSRQGRFAEDFELQALLLHAEGDWQGSGTAPVEADDLRRLAACQLVLKIGNQRELVGPVSAYLNAPVLEHTAISTDTGTAAARAASLRRDEPRPLAMPVPIGQDDDWALILVEHRGGTYAGPVTLKVEYFGRPVTIG